MSVKPKTLGYKTHFSVIFFVRFYLDSQVTSFRPCNCTFWWSYIINKLGSHDELQRRTIVSHHKQDGGCFPTRLGLLLPSQQHIFILFVNYGFRDSEMKCLDGLRSSQAAQIWLCFNTTFANNKVEANQSK